jgi:DNA-binding GntR family transcriptional regulator
MPKKTNKKKNLRIKAYNEIKDRILMFDLKPGEKIFEKDLVESLKISRTPVREALLMLERDRLVEWDKRLGFMVRRMQAQEIDVFFHIRELLEIYSAPLIVERITPQEIKALEKVLEKAVSHMENQDYRNLIRLNVAFHEILWRSVKSELFFQVISGLSDMFIWFRAIAARNRADFIESLECHKKILSAVQNKDAEELKMVLKRHLQHAKSDNLFVHGFFP